MNKTNILIIAGLLIIALSGVGSAAQVKLCYATGNTEGVHSHSWGAGAFNALYYHGSCNDLYVKYYIDISDNGGWSFHRTSGGDCTCAHGLSYLVSSGYGRGEGIYHLTGSNRGCYGRNSDSADSLKVTFVVSNTSFTEYNIIGSTDCVDSVKLYIGAISDGNVLNSTDLDYEGDNYSYKILDNYTYNLVFYPNLHSYQFAVDGSDITYDYDDCTHTQYRFEESCGNLIPDSDGFYREYMYGWGAQHFFNESDGILDISNSSANKFIVATNSFMGFTGWLIDSVVPNNTYTLTNSNIAWWLKVIVQNESDGTLLDDAMVHINQSCYCTNGYFTGNKKTVNGMAYYDSMSLQDASIHVTKDGYKFLDDNSTGYNVFLSGRSNFSGKTWIVKLAPSSSNNTSEWYETSNKVDIHFRDVNGNRTSQILDTDAEVYLYYENNNSENEAMTLKFQSSSTHSYFIDEESWSIPHDSIGHKTILNAKFTPYTYAYRAVIYNSSIYGWNMTIPLTVRNATKEDNQHYGNLTTNLWFMYAADGKIDSREDMRIVSHARSNNTTLMNIDLEVYKNSTLLCYKNLTASDYVGASYPYYYLYEPSYSYVSGANYTIKMYGFDRTLLHVRFVDCITDSITRKNKLTIIVKDNYGHNLNNAFVYLEGYGSLSTGINSYYSSYEGLPNKYYRYKATKTGYEGSGWSDVTISDSDEIVTYVLIATGDTNETSMKPVKMDDNEMKNLYYCLMMFLLIFILFGGLMYLAK